MTCTYHPYLVPKSPPPPVTPKPPLAPPAANVPYGPLTGPPSPKATWLVSSSGCGSGLALVGAGGFFGLILEFLPWISMASGSFSSTFGSDLVTPLDSLARTFWVWAGVVGKGTELTRVTPMASPPPPVPQPWPLGPVKKTE